MGALRRPGGLSYVWAYLRRRRYYAILAGLLIVVTVVLLWLWQVLSSDGKDLTLNLSSELIGTIIVLFVIAPFLTRGDAKNEAVLERFDHNGFIRQAGDARTGIWIMELWTDLLQGGYRRPFLEAVRSALSRQIPVRILLLDPDTRAAEQRTDDLLQQTDAVDNIRDNLQKVQEFVDGLPERLRQYLEIRVYRALPPVQMYRVDDRVIVSFYPVNVTSWNAAQYQTNPQAQLGLFVGSKFDELWEAGGTKTLGQFWRMSLELVRDDGERTISVRFISTGGRFLVSGIRLEDIDPNVPIDKLPVRITAAAAKGELMHSPWYSLKPLDKTADRQRHAQELFDSKYGDHDHELILELIPRPENDAARSG